jgi:hypothetical protein
MRRRRLIEASLLALLPAPAPAQIWQATPAGTPASAPLSPPPPPPLQGTVHHIAPSSSDQTAAVQAAINGAASGDTIYFDSGLHVINGVITAASNLLYIGPTVQFNGQARAVLQSPAQSAYPGTVTWQITSGSNITIYGLRFNAGLMNVNGCTNFNLTNCIIDTQRAADGPDALDYAGFSIATIQWNTFQNGAGTNNGGWGPDCDRVTFTRNKILACREPIGWTPGQNTSTNYNNAITFNYISGTSRMAIEIQAEEPPVSISRGWTINDNYIDGFSGATANPQGISVVSAGNAEIARNYVAGTSASPITNFAGIEFSCVPQSGSIHDNYIDGKNQPNSVGIYGGYVVADQTPVTNNNMINCGTQFHSAGGGGVFSGNTSSDRGRPPIPACGAGA